jgi:hypothetical protein
MCIATPKMKFLKAAPDGHEETMLVSIINLMEQPKRIVPSSVRFELRGQQIQTGSQVMHHVPKDGAPMGGDGFSDQEPMNFVSRFSLYLWNDRIGISGVIFPDLGIQISKMLLGAVNLDAHA